jgi:cytochrome d ubiquinol oxidase subunit II
MLGVVAVMVPVVIAYQTWMHLNFSHKLTKEDLEHDEAY